MSKAAVAGGATRGPSARQTSGTVQRTVRLLAAIADSGGDVTVGALAGRLALPNSTVHRLLHLLRREGAVEWRRADHRYVIGPEFFRIAARTVASAKLPDLAQPHLEHLSRRFREAAYFGLYLPTQRAVSFAAVSFGDNVLQYRPQMHERLTLLWGASGRSILAFLPREIMLELIEGAEISPTGLLPPSLADLDTTLKEVRAKSYATSAGHLIPGAFSVAAPVFAPGGVIGCIKMTMPRERIPETLFREIAEAVAAEARQFSRQLGGA